MSQDQAKPPVKAPEPAKTEATKVPTTAADLDAAFEEMRKKYAGEKLNPYDLSQPLAMQKWLISLGWRPLGDISSPWTAWEDPEGVKQEKQEYVVKKDLHFRGWDESTKPAKAIYEMGPVMRKDKFGQQQPTKQLHVTFPTPTYTASRAVEITIGRIRAAQETKQVA